MREGGREGGGERGRKDRMEGRDRKEGREKEVREYIVSFPGHLLAWE